jgi:GTP cyclohydrolase II
MEANMSPERFGAMQRVRIAARAKLPSRFGDFEVVAFEAVDGREHAAIVRGDVTGKRGVPVRLHSECFTGDVMGSLRCDCRQQLEESLAHIAATGLGAVLYLRQEGRGIGLANKIRAYALQEDGLDTVEANLALGFQDDERSYEVAGQMIRQLGIASVQVMTNNPKKVDGLVQAGIEVDGRIPVLVEPSTHNRAYLETKKKKSGHLL